jgi:transcriptional regulator with XRE-family HTH domain
MTFGEKLKELMHKAELTEAALAEKSGVPFGTLHTYVINRRAPSYEAVVKLAAALGTDCRAFSGCTFEYETGRAPAEPKRTSRRPRKPQS